MNVPLAEHWQRFVREEVLNGRFPSETAVLEEALALLRRREHEQGRRRPPTAGGPGRSARYSRPNPRSEPAVPAHICATDQAPPTEAASAAKGVSP